MIYWFLSLCATVSVCWPVISLNPLKHGFEDLSSMVYALLVFAWLRKSVWCPSSERRKGGRRGLLQAMLPFSVLQTIALAWAAVGLSFPMSEYMCNWNSLSSQALLGMSGTGNLPWGKPPLHFPGSEERSEHSLPFLPSSLAPFAQKLLLCEGRAFKLSVFLTWTPHWILIK